MKVTVKKSALYTNYRLVPDTENQQKLWIVCVGNKIIETFTRKDFADEFARLYRDRLSRGEITNEMSDNENYGQDGG